MIRSTLRARKSGDEDAAFSTRDSNGPIPCRRRRPRGTSLDSRTTLFVQRGRVHCRVRQRTGIGLQHQAQGGAKREHGPSWQPRKGRADLPVRHGDDKSEHGPR